MKLRSCAVALAPIVFALLLPFTKSAYAETDLRDSEALSYLPNNSVAALGYYRHVSPSDSQDLSEDVAIFRALYVMKFGNVALVPFDAFMPVVDATVWSGATRLHSSGIGDVTYLPTLAYTIPGRAQSYLFRFQPELHVAHWQLR